MSKCFLNGLGFAVNGWGKMCCVRENSAKTYVTAKARYPRRMNTSLETGFLDFSGKSWLGTEIFNELIKRLIKYAC